jgi:drug/metabolite transporter (DMT)-like permease
MTTPSMSGRDWTLILLLSLIWGGAFFLNALGLRGFPTNSLVFVRMAVAVVPLLLVIRLTGESLPRGWLAWRGLALLGALNIVVPFILFTWAQTMLASGLASVLNATTPLWGIVVAHFLTDTEKATPTRVAGVLLGVIGVGVMMLPSFSGGVTDQSLALIACLAATLCYALSSIVALRLNTGGMTPLSLTTGQLLVAAIIMLPIMLVVDQPWTLPMPSTETILAVLALALVSTSLAYWLYFKVLESAGASNSLLITFLMPVTAILLGIVFLGEQMTTTQLGGMALIAAGLLVMDGRVLGRRLAAT